MTTAVLSKHNTIKRPRVGICPRELEVEDFITEEDLQPVRVNGVKLEVDSAQLEIRRVYPFIFLDTKMVLWKSEDTSVDIYQVIEE